MKKQWSLIGILVLVLVIVIFSWLNVQPVTVNFGFSQVTMPLVVILVISLLLGVILAVLFSMTTILQQKQELKQIKSKLESNQAMRRADKNIRQDTKTKEK
ncbi:lipopolysaccharide assembly LapA domain-containing protein [uncultured Ligilactobacillus sp.]|uniref:LapA family protein n=1 Tax=uncultured Ligilactobacillus sp. TaxID=2837633 RepID=UPI00272D9D1F|nr:LapA family protein [uncultured Ligilactobacillus sp.]